jgi:hypothetical protein
MRDWLVNHVTTKDLVMKFDADSSLNFDIYSISLLQTSTQGIPWRRGARLMASHCKKDSRDKRLAQSARVT